ncbi:MAG: radical SAM protein [Candidatus Omnitrophota bacterium]
MKLKKIISPLNVIAKITEVRLFNKIRLLNVNFSVTSRCNLNCKYCWRGEISKNNNHNFPDEMKLVQIKKAFHNLRELYAEVINITGGEPLVREDISEIIRAGLKDNLWVSLTTNGVLLTQRLKEIDEVKLLIVSLDGKKESNDSLRGEGTFLKVIKGIELSKNLGVPLMLSCVISAKTQNEDIDFLLNLAKFYEIYCIFHPVNDRGIVNDKWEVNSNIKKVKTEKNELINKLNYLKNHQLINKSCGGKYWCELMKEFQEKQEILKNKLCFGGRLFVNIESNGVVTSCGLSQDPLLRDRIFDQGFLENYQLAVRRISCKGCFCYSYKMINDISKFNLRTIKNFLIQDKFKY